MVHVIDAIIVDVCGPMLEIRSYPSPYYYYYYYHRHHHRRDTAEGDAVGQPPRPEEFSVLVQVSAIQIQPA